MRLPRVWEQTTRRHRERCSNDLIILVPLTTELILHRMYYLYCHTFTGFTVGEAKKKKKKGGHYYCRIKSNQHEQPMGEQFKINSLSQWHPNACFSFFQRRCSLVLVVVVGSAAVAGPEISSWAFYFQFSLWLWSCNNCVCVCVDVNVHWNQWSTTKYIAHVSLIKMNEWMDERGNKTKNQSKVRGTRKSVQLLLDKHWNVWQDKSKLLKTTTTTTRSNIQNWNIKFPIEPNKTKQEFKCFNQFQWFPLHKDNLVWPGDCEQSSNSRVCWFH